MAAALIGSPIVVTADPTPIAARSAPANAPKPAAAEDVAHYAQAEQQSPETAKFEGGARGIYIGGGALMVILIVLLVIIII
ncbi:MAG: hypothetical protein M4D80_12750 [Myxococcota bacterium]|nr:hypothetical protein [Myxococcota bacterium]